MSSVLFHFASLPTNRNFGSGLIPPLPEPEPFSDVDRAFAIGFGLGLQDRSSSLAPTNWPPFMVDSFYEGLAWGEIQSSAIKTADYEQHLDRLATAAGFDVETGNYCW